MDSDFDDEPLVCPSDGRNVVPRHTVSADDSVNLPCSRTRRLLIVSQRVGGF